MQFIAGTLPRAPPPSHRPHAAWGNNKARKLLGFPATGPGGVLAPSTRTNRPPPLQLLPHVNMVCNFFVPPKTTRVTHWDLGFPRVTALTTNAQSFPLEAAAPSPPVELPPLPDPPPLPLYMRLPTIPEPKARSPSSPPPYSGRWKLSLSERRVIVVGWLRSLGRERDSRPTKEEFVLGGAVVGVKWYTAREYWQKRFEPFPTVGRPSTATEEAKPDITVILEMIRGAKSYIYASYFILTSEEVALALIALASMGGRQVLLYLDANQASKGGNSNAALIAMCLAADIKVKVRPSTSMMHEKFILVDGTMLFVGSSNATVNGIGTTARPVARNQEANVYLERSTVTEDFRKKFVREFNLANDVESVMDSRSSGVRGSS